MIALYNGKTVRPDDWAALRAAVPYAQASSPHGIAGVAKITQVSGGAVTVLARTQDQATIVLQGVVFYVDSNRAWAVGGVVVDARSSPQDLALAFRIGLAGLVSLFLFVVLGTLLGALVGALGGPVSFIACYLLFLRR